MVQGIVDFFWKYAPGVSPKCYERARPQAPRSTADSRVVDREIARRAKAGPNLFLPFMMLVDDLAVIPDRAKSLLAAKLHDAEGQIRCAAADVVLALGGGLPAVLPLLDDPAEWVRMHVIGLLAEYGDDSMVEPLIARLRSDPEPGVRGQAAYSLGHIGCPAAILDLLEALDHDHECDELGHSPSSVSATALDEILGTNHTRIRHDGFCSPPASWPPDIDGLKEQARDLHRTRMAIHKL